MKIRAAYHESGHLIPVWCSDRALVERIMIDDAGNGEVSRLMPNRPWALVPTSELWVAVVVALGGIAGDFCGGYRVHPWDVVGDLVRAKEKAEQIALRVDPRVAFPVDTAGHQQITRMFAGNVSEGGKHVLEAAYLKARMLIRAYKPEHRTMVLALLLLGSLDGGEVLLLLGECPPSLFALPRRSALVRVARCSVGLVLVLAYRGISSVWRRGRAWWKKVPT